MGRAATGRNVHHTRRAADRQTRLWRGARNAHIGGNWGLTGALLLCRSGYRGLNYADPFGLCPPADNDTADCSDEVKRLMAIDKPLESPAFDPVAFATGFVGGLFKGAGARAVAAEADEAAAGVRAATRGLEKQLEKHIQKLEQYKANPFAFDNKGLLRNAPSDEIRQKIIAGRIRKLEGQIETFRKAIQKAIDEATKR